MTIRMREACIEDNDQLMALQAKCPHGTSVVMRIVNVPDFFSRARTYEHSRVFVACEGDRIVGSAACAIRRCLVDGRPVVAGYLFEAFVDPACRRMGIAAMLCARREEYLREQSADLAYTLIMEGNVPSMRYIERQGYRRHRDFVITGLHVFKDMPLPRNRAIRRAGPDDLDDIAKLLNETWQGYDFYVPASPDSLEAAIARTPGFSLRNLLLLEEGGEIVACTGYWVWDEVMKITVLELNTRYRIDSAMLAVNRLFRPMPRAIRKGQRLRPIVLTPIGFRDPARFASLIRFLNNRAVRYGNDMIYCVCEPDHPMLGELRSFHHVNTDLYLYVKPLGEPLRMDRPAFVSGRDL